MSKRERLIFAAVFIGTFGLIAVAYALTTEQLFNAWYDSGNSAIRINVVAGGS